MLILQNHALARAGLHRKPRTRRGMRGFSIIELMIGMTIGLFLLTGASLLFVNNISNSRSILTQARVEQNLRNIMDLVTRDLRRAGYWQNALSGATTTGAAAASNPYTGVALTTTNGAPNLSYAYADPLAVDDSAAASRVFGFRLNTTNNSVEMNLGGSSANWQSLTDSNTVQITGFTITPTLSTIDIRAACPNTCTGSSCPSVTVRTYNVVLTGVATRDSAISRTLRSQVRVRNDLLAGTCPA